MIKQKNEYGTVWFSGDKPQEACFINGDKKKDKVFICRNIKPRSFGSYPNIDELLKYIKENNFYGYEIIRTERPRKPYFDIDYYSTKENDILDNVISYLIKQFKDKCNVKLTTKDFKISKSSGLITKTNIYKQSFHLILKKYYFENHQEQCRFMNCLYREIDYSNDETLKSLLKPNNSKFTIDEAVYNKNQQLRLILSMKSEEDQRRFLPFSSGMPNDFLATVEDTDKLIKIDVSKCSEELKLNNQGETRKTIRVTTNYTNADVKLKEVEYTKTMKPDLRTKLFLIPNQDEYYQSFQAWRNIALSLSDLQEDEKEEEIFKLFEEWTKQDKNIIHNDKLIKKTWKEVMKQPKKYHNRKRLDYLVKKICPALMCQDEKMRAVKLNWKLDLSNIDIFNDTPDEERLKKYSKNSIYLLQDEDVNKLIKDYKSVILKSNCGMGKTEVSSEICKKYKRVLYITFRTSQAPQACERLGLEWFKKTITKKNGDIVDVPLSKKELEKENKICISIQSIYRLEGLKDFDLVIVDESESVLRSITEKIFCNTSKKNDSRQTGIEILENLFRNSKKIIYMDAYITNLTLDHVRFFADKTLLINNDFIKVDRPYNLVKTKQDCESILIDKLKKGEKCVVFYTKKKYSLELFSKIKKDFPNKKIALHFGNDASLTPREKEFYQVEENKKGLENPNKYWIDKDIVIHTQTITVGVDFSVKDYFQNQFVIVTTETTTPEEIAQGMMRVRHYSDNMKTYIKIEDKIREFINCRYPIFMDKVKESKKEFVDNTINNCLNILDEIKNGKTQLNNFEQWLYNINDISDKLDLVFKDLNKWLENIYYHNLLIHNNARENFYHKLLYILHRTGYKPSKESFENMDEIEKVSIRIGDKISKKAIYHLINKISDDECEYLEKKKLEIGLTIEENNQLSKYYFLTHFDHEKINRKDEIILAKFYDYVYMSFSKRDKFKNIYHEIQKDIKNLRVKDVERNEYQIYSNLLFEKYQLVNRLKEIFNFNSSTDNYIISKESLYSKSFQIEDLINTASKILGYPDLKIKITPETETKKILRRLNNILSEWGFYILKWTEDRNQEKLILDINRDDKIMSRMDSEKNNYEFSNSDFQRIKEIIKIF